MFLTKTQFKERYIISLYAATLLVALTNKSSLAVTIMPLPSDDSFAVSSVSYSLNGGQDTTNSNRTDTVQTNRYQVSGNRQGRVTVKNTVSGEVIRTFQMDEGVVVRETFLLNNDRTVAASQKDHTVFWDLTTGREIGRVDQRVYGFSQDESKFFTQSNEGIVLYSYPDLTPDCTLTARREAGARFFLFSLDNHFLFIQFHSGFPASDQSYPYPIVDASAVYAKLFNLQICQEVQEFSAHRSHVSTVNFSEDSRFLYLENLLIYLDGIRQHGNWYFNLENYKFEKFSK